MPGKFEGNPDPELAEKLCNAMADDDLGDVETFGWYGLIKGIDDDEDWFIVNEDSQGFFTIIAQGDSSTILPRWDRLQGEYSSFMEESEEEV
jgi:hypothetical protein